jgi:hypothetical protein
MDGDFCPICGGEGDGHEGACLGPDVDTNAYFNYCAYCGKPNEECHCEEGQ